MSNVLSDDIPLLSLFFFPSLFILWSYPCISNHCHHIHYQDAQSLSDKCLMSDEEEPSRPSAALASRNSK